MFCFNSRRSHRVNAAGTLAHAISTPPQYGCSLMILSRSPIIACERAPVQARSSKTLAWPIVLAPLFSKEIRMLKNLLDILFGCSHRRASLPLRPRGKPGISGFFQTYGICLHCGTEFEYAWQKMEVCNAVDHADFGQGTDKPCELFASLQTRMGRIGK